jgi:hypothetical protein
MRRLTITGLCALALLSGRTSGGVTSGGVTSGGVASGPPVKLPCSGKDKKLPDTHIGTGATTVHFVADGTCKVTKFIFIGNGHDPPPGFTQRTFPPSATIDYHFSGGTIPEAGYYFTYVNDDPNDGNGGGVVKN